MSDTTGSGLDPSALLDGILSATAAEGRGFVAPEAARPRAATPEDKAAAEADRLIRALLDQILRHPRFVALRARWTALHRLANGTDGATRIAVVPATKRELVQELNKASSLDETFCWKALVEDGLDPAAPQPVGALLVDAEWSAEPEDLDTLQLLGGIGSVAHCPVLTHAAPKLIGQDAWDGLPSEGELKRRMDGPGRARWRSFRDSEESRFVALALPPVRLAEPDASRAWTDHGMGGAWVLAEAIAAGAAEEGWGVPPAGWQAEGLDGRDAGGPLKVVASDPALLAGMGLITAVPALASGARLPVRSTAQAAKRFDRDAATRRAVARAQLDHVLATGRFAQALTVLGHRLRQGGASPERVRGGLAAWVAPFCDGPDAPLAEARIDLQPGRGGEGPTLVAWLAPRIGLGEPQADGVVIDVL